MADLSLAARKALLGSAYTLKTGVTGKVAWSIGTDQVITLKCATTATQDADKDGFTPAQKDCDDTDPTVNPLAAEVFSGKDDNCDDAFHADTYYTGPAETKAILPCHEGQRAEITTPPYYEVTVPEVTPVPEVAGDGVDNDCDGAIDEG